MAVEFHIGIDEGTRVLRGDITGAPDVTPEQSCLTTTFRPESILLEYVSNGLSGWRLKEVTVSGRLVNKAGEVNRTTRRQQHATWADLTGSGKTHKAVTPKWVVDLARKYMTDPDSVPHITR
jgi:hypothetical protein